MPNSQVPPSLTSQLTQSPLPVPSEKKKKKSGVKVGPVNFDLKFRSPQKAWENLSPGWFKSPVKFDTKVRSPQEAWENLSPNLVDMPKSGKGKNSTPKFIPGVSAWEGVSQRDILNGTISVENVTPEEMEALTARNPDLAKAVQYKKDLNFQELVKEAQGGNRSGIDPMAVQLLFQNAINPFLSSVVQGSNQQTQSYQGMMNQLLQSGNLPEPYRQSLAAQVPQNVNNMNSLTTALAGYTATQPSIQSLLRTMYEDAELQKAALNQQKLQEQQMLLGQGFSLQ